MNGLRYKILSFWYRCFASYFRYFRKKRSICNLKRQQLSSQVLLYHEKPTLLQALFQQPKRRIDFFPRTW